MFEDALREAGFDVCDEDIEVEVEEVGVGTDAEREGKEGQRKASGSRAARGFGHKRAVCT